MSNVPQGNSEPITITMALPSQNRATLPKAPPMATHKYTMST